MTIKTILKALLQDDLASAISGMLELAGQTANTSLQNQLYHQSGRFHGNEKRLRDGVLTDDQYNRTRNQLRLALQELVKDFPDYSPQLANEAQRELLTEKTAPAADPPTDPSTTFERYKILMLTSNPSGTAELQLNKEHSYISRQIQNASDPARFPIKPKQAVTLSTFSESIYDEQPVIVHFSGHGERDGRQVEQTLRRGLGIEEEAPIGDNTGIILTSEDGREPFFVPTEVIRRIFRTMIHRHAIPIQAVVFNSCYSEEQATALADLVPYVIGTSWSIRDEAAIAFASGFYSFFTRTEDFEAAWDNGVTQAMAHREPEERFILFKNGERVKL